MRFIEGSGESMHLVELTRRNLQGLLDKLDDPQSQRLLIDPDRQIAVRAVEDEEHYSTRDPGIMYMPSTGGYR